MATTVPVCWTNIARGYQYDGTELKGQPVIRKVEGECSSRVYGCSSPHTGGCLSPAEGVEGGKIRRRSMREAEWDVAPERRGEARQSHPQDIEEGRVVLWNSSYYINLSRPVTSLHELYWVDPFFLIVYTFLTLIFILKLKWLTQVKVCLIIKKSNNFKSKNCETHYRDKEFLFSN